MAKEFPDIDELVLCTVTTVQTHSVFVQLDEYGRSGLIHISEIAPGRIRNIREYVKEGKKVVCKVLAVNMEKGHIDLSLRRVSLAQQKAKQDEIKQGHLVRKILEHVAKQCKTTTEEMMQELKPAVQKYGSLYAVFEEVSTGTASLDKFLTKQTAKTLTEVIQQRIKPKEIRLVGSYALTSYAPNGIELIKTVLKPIEQQTNTKVRYTGAGTYHIEVTSQNPKEAEKKFKQINETLKKESSAKKVQLVIKEQS